MSPTPKLEDHIFSAVLVYIFDMFAAPLNFCMPPPPFPPRGRTLSWQQSLRRAGFLILWDNS